MRRTRPTSAIGILAALPLFFSFPFAAKALGCCEVLTKASPPACKDPSCVVLCASMPTISSCEQVVSVAGLGTKHQWNSGSCWGLPECAGKAPQSCCIIKKGEAKTCYAVHNSAQCNFLAEKLSASPDSFKGGSCASLDECKGRLEDPNLYGAAAATTASEPPPPAPPPKLVVPQLSVNIPNLSLSQVQVEGDGGNKYIDIPWIAQYVQAAYAWLLGVVSALATAMIVYGGLKWLSAGGSPERVSSAKTTITNAIIGLILAFGSYTILSTINPALLRLGPLTVSVVERKLHVVEVSASDWTAATGEKAKSPEEIKALAVKLSKEAGIPPCLVLGSMEHESRGKQLALGHDENAQWRIKTPARLDFLNSGVKYSKEKFEPIPGRDPSIQPSKIVNDDTFKPNEPPEYGLDWRFSHGFGPVQATIFPNSQACPGKGAAGRGFRFGGKCYTIPELLSAEGSVGVSVTLFKDHWEKGGHDAGKAYARHAGGGITPAHSAIQARVKSFQKCMENPPT